MVGSTDYTFTPSGGQCSRSITLSVQIVSAPLLIIHNPDPVCLPASVDLTAPSVTAGSTDGLTYSYWIDEEATIPLPNPDEVTASGTYYIKGVASGGCSAISPAEVTIHPSLEAPLIIVSDPACLSPYGTITVTSPVPDGNISFSIDGVNYSNSDGVFTDVTPGQYNVTVKSEFGCVSPSTSAIVNPPPSQPPIPVASVSAQPTCAVPTGTITVTSPAEGSGYKYSIDSGASWSDQSTFTGLIPGDYNVSVQDIATGCVSVPVTLTVDPVPSAPSAPVAVVSAQPTCTAPTGTITVSAPLGAEYEYSIDGVNYQSAVTFSGLVPGDYYVTVRNTGDNSCVSDPSVLTVNPVPGAPSAPSASVTVTANLCHTYRYHYCYLACRRLRL